MNLKTHSIWQLRNEVFKIVIVIVKKQFVTRTKSMHKNIESKARINDKW